MPEPTELTPERLAEIRRWVERAGDDVEGGEFYTIALPVYHAHAAGLLAEVERLRKASEPAPCVFPLGGTCKFDGRDPFEVIYEEADDQRGRAVVAEMRLERAQAEVDRLRAEVSMTPMPDLDLTAAVEVAAKAAHARRAAAANDPIFGVQAWDDLPEFIREEWMLAARAAVEAAAPLIEAAVRAKLAEEIEASIGGCTRFPDWSREHAAEMALRSAARIVRGDS